MGSTCCCLISTVDSLIVSKMTRGPQWFLLYVVLGNCAVLEQNMNHFLSSVCDFCLQIYFLKKRGILRKFFFDKICSRIHKNELIYKLCTILEWDKYQQFADFIKFLVFWFALTQSCKTFVRFFMDQTLHTICKIQSFFANFPLEI